MNDVRDDFDILERLCDIHDGPGREADARAIRERLEREAPRDDDNLCALPDDKMDDDFILEPIEHSKGTHDRPQTAMPCGSERKYKTCCGR